MREDEVGTMVPVSENAEGRTVLALATMESAPDVVLAEAQKAAQALQKVIASKTKKVVMNGEQYLEFEDWQTVGRFYGVTAKEDGDPEAVDFGLDDDGKPVRGFKASAVAIDRHGHVLSRATAYCLSDEEKWSSRAKYAYGYLTRSGGFSVEDPGKDEIIWEPNPDKPGKNRPKKERRHIGEERVPLFQMASMAQTRAAAKVLRNVLSWVVVMAGYRPTPAEELDATPQPNGPTNGGNPPADVVDAEVTDSTGNPLASEAERVKAACAEPNPTYAGDATCPKGHEGKPWKGARPGKPETHFCSTCKQPFAPGKAVAA
jgi:hypothetical protein